MRVKPKSVKKIRAADAKEVGVGNPAEETYCYPNNENCMTELFFVNSFSPYPAVQIAFAKRMILVLSVANVRVPA
jgi:hypothetical protein